MKYYGVGDIVVITNIYHVLTYGQLERFHYFELGDICQIIGHGGSDFYLAIYNPKTKRIGSKKQYVPPTDFKRMDEVGTTNLSMRHLLTKE